MGEPSARLGEVEPSYGRQPPAVASRGAPRANPADAPTVILGALAAASIGALLYNVLPLYLGGMQEGKGLGSAQTGLMGAAFFFGFNLSGFSAFLWIRRFHWRILSLLAVPAILAALLFSVTLSSVPPLLAVTAISGAAFGVIYTIGSVIIGDTSAPERWYGVKVAAESTVGALVMLAAPATLIARYGFGGTVAGMAICVVALLPLLFYLPRAWIKEAPLPERTGEGASETNLGAIGCAILSLLLLFASVSAIWAFAERMGRLSGFSAESVGALLAVTLLAGVAGSVLVAVVGSRVDAVRSFVACVAAILVALACLSIKGNFPLYVVGNCLYMLGWAAGTPLAMAEIARLDGDGRYVALLAPAIGVGSMIGPGVAGWLLEVSTPLSLLTYTAAVALAAAVALIVAARLARAATPTLAAEERP